MRSYNPNALMWLLNIIIVVWCMYYTCNKYSYISNVILYTLLKTFVTPIFNKLLSLMILWEYFGISFSFTQIVLNLILGSIMVLIFKKILEYIEDDKTFVLIGTIIEWLLLFILSVFM